MIWHGDVFVQIHLDKLLRQPLPPVFNHLSSVIQLHLASDNFAIKAFSMLGTGVEKVVARRRIVISPRANGSTMMFFGVVRHETDQRRNGPAFVPNGVPSTVQGTPDKGAHKGAPLLHYHIPNFGAAGLAVWAVDIQSDDVLPCLLVGVNRMPVR